MAAVVKHTARNKPGTAGTATPAQPRNSQLRRQFPPRPVQEWWPAAAQGEDEALRRLTSPPFLPEMKATRAGRRRGTAKLLRWLSSFPGDTWQQRWQASRAEDHPGSSWVQLPARWLQDNGLRASSDDNDLSSGLLMLICGDAIRPGLAWMLTRTHRYLALVMAEARDPAGFARLRELAEAGPASSLDDARYAATRVATLMACKGGVVSDITVGDCVELADTQRRVHARGGQRKVDFYPAAVPRHLPRRRPGDLLLAQVPGHVLDGGLVPDVDPAAGAPPALSSGRLGEQQVQGGQVRHDAVLANVGVRGPIRVGRAGGGVAMAAPVGGLAIRPRRFHPSPTDAACQQPGQQVPPLLRTSEVTAERRAAGDVDVLGGDEISFADQGRADRVRDLVVRRGEVAPDNRRSPRLSTVCSLPARSWAVCGLSIVPSGWRLSASRAVLTSPVRW